MLEPKLDPKATMSRGKPLPVGPTARLPQGMDWDTLAAMSPEEIRAKDVFPYKALPHPGQGGGLRGQVFPQTQIEMFPRLERYDIEFDLPNAFSFRKGRGLVDARADGGEGEVQKPSLSPLLSSFRRLTGLPARALVG